MEGIVRTLLAFVLLTMAGCQSLRGADEGLAGIARFSEGGPRADEYGRTQGYPTAAIYRPKFFVGTFSHQDQLLEGRNIRRADTPRRLRRASAEPVLSYRYEGEERTIDGYLARNPVTGLLIARDDTILVERYQYARNDSHRFTSASMAKTLTSMLIGVAIADGRIRSLDDVAATYVPDLADTEYGRTSLRHLLQMSSGVRFDETYGGASASDFSRLWIGTVGQDSPGGASVLKQFNHRSRAPGTAFAYSSAETQVLGLVLANAVGSTVADYLRLKIWDPMGAESDASWIIDAAGQEATYCCFNAGLRDFARLALLLANDGRIGERQIIPKAWIVEATTVAADRPDMNQVWSATQFGYGYHTWIFAGQRRMFALIGVHGQAIYIDPTSRLVLVQTAVRLQFDDPNKETLALWQGILDSLGSAQK